MSGVTVRHPGAPDAVRDLSLEITSGETVVLLGRSGSGKTTTLKLINALVHPSAGSIETLGRAVDAWPPHELRRRIGYVIQDVGLFPHLSVLRNVTVVPELLGWNAARSRARAEELVALVGLAPEEFLQRMPRQLSGGQRQRVGLARALAADPPLLLMDEPFGALDPLTRSDLLREFRTLVQRLGKTIVFVTHDVREAMLIGTRIVLLGGGRVVFDGAPGAFVTAEEPEVRAFARVLAS